MKNIISQHNAILIPLIRGRLVSQGSGSGVRSYLPGRPEDGWSSLRIIISEGLGHQFFSVQLVRVAEIVPGGTEAHPTR